MALTDGIDVVGTYTAVTLTDATQGDAVVALVDELIRVIGDPETAPAQAGGGNLDSMSPAANAQLQVELNAIKDSISPTS